MKLLINFVETPFGMNIFIVSWFYQEITYYLGLRIVCLRYTLISLYKYLILQLVWLCNPLPWVPIESVPQVYRKLLHYLTLHTIESLTKWCLLSLTLLM